MAKPQQAYCHLLISRVNKFALVLVFLVSQLYSDTAVTYHLSEGRFGDQLLCYLHAKWISYHYGFRLLYKPFVHSEDFKLHEFEEHWSEEKETDFNCVKWHVKDAGFPSQDSLLYVIPFFSGNEDDLKYHPEWAAFPIDWKDPGFRSVLRDMFEPRHELPMMVKPDNSLSIALHVRRGGGYDPADSHLLWPLRFPPDSYYVSALRKICELFPDKPLYVFLFTDDPDPAQIVDKYAQKLQGLPITFDYRREGNRHNAHVLEDFFAMIQFDGLIRSVSNFSLIPSVIGNYKVVITPKHYTWVYNPSHTLNIENVIDEIDIGGCCKP